MSEPVAVLKIVHSSLRSGLLSIRGPKGRSADDAAHEHITAAGFGDGDDVVLIRAGYYARLVAAAKGNRKARK